MPIDPKLLRTQIETALPGAKVAVDDLVGDGDHLQAIVVTELFQGKTLLEQHQMVYAPLKEVLKADLHALALKTYTPEQWEKFGKK